MKTRCPKCAEEGRDQRGTNATTYPDGRTFCHAGHGVISGQQTEVTRMESKISVQDCLSEPAGHDPERKISDEVIAKYGIRCVYDTSSGKPKRTYYPYSDRDGKITGFKVRNIQSKEFFIAGKLNGLWGKQAAHKTPHGALIITEGEEDALAIAEMLRNSPGSVHDVVSVPHGANSDGRVDASVQSDIDFIRRYAKVYLCLDNDEPGRATAKKLAGWLSGFVPDVRLVEVPNKDASACLMGGFKSEFAAAVKGTPQFRPEGIVHGSEISIQDLMRSVPEGFSTPYPGLNDKLHGVRKGEILTVCAGSGIGKSTLVKEIGYDLVVRHGLKVCHIALEDVVEATAASYIAMDNNVPASRFRTDPGCIPMRLVEASMDRTVRRMYFFNHFGSIDSSTFKEKLFYYARSGVDFIILDHLSMVISGSDVQNERKEIDKIMTDLAQMVVSTGVGLINVVHLKRRESRDAGKSLNEGGAVSLTDLRGSAALEQLSWGVLAMERNQQAEDGSEDFVSLRVLKNRTWGFTGSCGRAKYVHSSGRMLPVDDELPVPDPHSLDEVYA
jgi:twinkle protein